MMQFNVANQTNRKSKTWIRPSKLDKVVYMLFTDGGNFNEIHGG